MPLNAAAADAAAQAFCTANGITDAAAVAKWKSYTEKIYSSIAANIDVVLNTGTVVTVGSATTQTGPAAPVTLMVT